MSKIKMNPCQYCDPFPHTLEFVEVTTLNFDNAIAVECLSCGCRGMAADAKDGEEMATSLWNDMRVANNCVQPTPASGRVLPVESTNSKGSVPAKSG